MGRLAFGGWLEGFDCEGNSLMLLQWIADALKAGRKPVAAIHWEASFPTGEMGSHGLDAGGAMVILGLVRVGASLARFLQNSGLWELLGIGLNDRF